MPERFHDVHVASMPFCCALWWKMLAGIAICLVWSLLVNPLWLSIIWLTWFLRRERSNRVALLALWYSTSLSKAFYMALCHDLLKGTPLGKASRSAESSTRIFSGPRPKEHHDNWKIINQLFKVLWASSTLIGVSLIVMAWHIIVIISDLQVRFWYSKKGLPDWCCSIVWDWR